MSCLSLNTKTQIDTKIKTGALCFNVWEKNTCNGFCFRENTFHGFCFIWYLVLGFHLNTFIWFPFQCFASSPQTIKQAKASNCGFYSPTKVNPIQLQKYKKKENTEYKILK